ncbi:MAG: hypothetical protein QJT81_03355 [Candidatus Thiothrix putei]|uniref:Sortilin N-terminal domain-containing protein n=1 Tax=Candidatus Thiothrix putei TaxID=3080811 RepID=A0AA95HCR1_9GAMM|nr:MAG: hypothetical protein QJT81_03355 [Candidatus Thiothrix putei]
MSTNSGATWIKQASGLSKIRIQKLVVHPTKANELYAISAPDRFVPKSAANQKIYKSTNSGKTWQEFAPTIKKTVFDFGLIKANPNEMYLSTDVGVLYSTNAGVSWSNTGLPPEYDYFGKNIGYSLWLPTTASGQVKVISNALTVWGTKNGVWLANKSGAQFTWTSATPVTNSIGAKSTWEIPDYWHYAERGDADLLTSFYHNGESLRTIATDPRNANRIVMVNDQWALQSNDNGKSFNNLFTKAVGTAWASRGLENINVYTVAASRWTANNILFAGYADIGCWRSLNSGTSWESCQAPGKGWDGDYGGNTSTIITDPSRQGVVWAAMGKAVEGVMSLMRSNQSGKFDSWSTSMNGIPNADATLMFGLSVDRNSPVNQRTLFVTANGNVYRSQDDGKNWKKVLDCRSRTQQQNGVQAYCTSTAVDYFNRNLVYAAGSAGVFTSQDGGNTWSLTNTERMTAAVSLADLFVPHGAGRYFVSDIVADPLTPNQVYIAVFDQKNSTNLGGIWMGTKGSSWSRLYKNPYLRSVAASPYKKGELLALSSYAYKYLCKSFSEKPPLTNQSVTIAKFRVTYA